MTAGPAGAPRARDLVGVVQRFGLFSAASVVDRYAELVDRVVARDLVPPPAEPAGGLAGRLAQAWLGLVDAAAGQLRGDAARLPAPETLVLPPAAPGLGTEAALWIHNTTSAPAVAVHLHATALLSTTGRTIPPDAVSLVPDRIDLVPAGTSREVRLRVRVPVGQAAGTYHGMLVTTAAPAEPMGLTLEVTRP